MKVIDHMEKNLSDELETQKFGAEIGAAHVPAPLLPLRGRLEREKQLSLGDFYALLIMKDT